MTKQPDIMRSEVSSFMKSRVILTAAELDFFTRLHEKPASAQQIAQETALDPRAATRLLDCLIPLGLLKKQDDQYQPTDQGKLFSSRHPESVLPMVLHMNHLWGSWSHLTDIIKKGPNQQQNPLEEQEEKGHQASFVGAMHVAGRSLSREIAKFYDLSPYKKLLDIGGASGTYTIAFLERNLEMTGVIFDLENVIPMARETIRKEGLQERVALVAGDFYQDELPEGCDLALLSAIIHQNSPDQNFQLCLKIFRALNNGGAILIRDHIMDESRTNPPAGALFALNMLVNTPSGDTYTFGDVKETLEKAGFVEVKWIRVGERMDSLVEARKPLQTQ